MQSPSNTQQTKSKLRHWLSDALFTGRSAADYFAPLIQAIDPDWAPGRTLATIESIHDETSDSKTFILRPHTSWKGFEAGQHVAIEIDIHGRNTVRTFTIASTPAHLAKTGTVALTIKRNPEGRVTPYLFDELRVGTRVGISAATGKFLLPEQHDQTLLYLAAGSGITPVMSHLRKLVEDHFPIPVTLIYYASHKQDHIFLQELQTIAKACARFKLFLVNTREENSRATLQGRIEASHIQTALADRKPTQVYICGPQGFDESARNALETCIAPNTSIVSEHFGGLVAKHGDSSVHQVRLRNSERILDASAQTTLLDTAEQNGLRPQAGCRMGICHTCKCKKTEGRVRNLVTGEVSDAGEEMIQLCITTPETDITLEL